MYLQKPLSKEGECGIWEGRGGGEGNRSAQRKPSIRFFEKMTGAKPRKCKRRARFEPAFFTVGDRRPAGESRVLSLTPCGGGGWGEQSAVPYIVRGESRVLSLTPCRGGGG